MLLMLKFLKYIYIRIMIEYPLLSLKIIFHKVDQMHEQNILLVKFYFKSLKNQIFLFSPYGIMLTFTWF